MKDNSTKFTPMDYEIVIRGILPSNWVYWFDGWTIASSHEGTTVLTGTIVDQAELHGLLNIIGNLNLKLVSLQPKQEMQK